MRGFQSEDTAELMTAAFRNYYNFIKHHNSNNGLTPAQIAGVGVENGSNKWEELLLSGVLTITRNGTKPAVLSQITR